MPPKSQDEKSNQRAVGTVEFIRPVNLPDLGWQKRLVAGESVYKDSQPQGQKLAVPIMWRDGDTGEMVIGSRRFPIQGGVIEWYELARGAGSAK